MSGLARRPFGGRPLSSGANMDSSQRSIEDRSLRIDVELAVPNDKMILSAISETDVDTGQVACAQAYKEVKRDLDDWIWVGVGAKVDFTRNRHPFT